MSNTVEVYYNLHKKLFSIRDKKTGLVIGHAPTVSLKDCSFRVSQKGRERVIRERRKNVHAFVVGTLMDPADVMAVDYATPVGYNPYQAGHFIRKDNGEAISCAKHVVLSKKGGIACF